MRAQLEVSSGSRGGEDPPAAELSGIRRGQHRAAMRAELELRWYRVSVCCIVSIDSGTGTRKPEAGNVSRNVFV